MVAKGWAIISLLDILLLICWRLYYEYGILGISLKTYGKQSPRQPDDFFRRTVPCRGPVSGGCLWLLRLVYPSQGSGMSVDVSSTLAALREARFLSQRSRPRESGRDAPPVRHLTATLSVNDWGGRPTCGILARGIMRPGYDAVHCPSDSRRERHHPSPCNQQVSSSVWLSRRSDFTVAPRSRAKAAVSRRLMAGSRAP